MNVNVKTGKPITIVKITRITRQLNTPLFLTIIITTASPLRTPAFSTDASPSNLSTPAVGPNNFNAGKTTKLKPKPKWLTCLTSRLTWVPANSTFAKWKPVLRCALVGWVSLVLFVIPAVEREMGQASILILTVAFLSPPSDPFLMMLEREILLIFFVCVAWAWACLGIFLANLSRNFHDPNVTFLEAATGRYIEAAPSVIMAVFIFFGSAFFLFIRAKKGPGPYFVPTVLACICLDVSFTTACIYPYPFYNSGRGVVLPVSMHTAVCIVASLTVFPSTISALFTTRLVAVLSPLQEMLEKNIDLLAIGPYDGTLAENVMGDEETLPEGGSRRRARKDCNGAVNGNQTSDFHLSTPVPSSSPTSYVTTLATVRALKRAGEAALAPLASASRLLHNDLIYARFAPSDLDAFHELSRKLAGRADGLGIYFELVEAGLTTSPNVNFVSEPEAYGIGGEGGGKRGIGSGGGGMVKGAEEGPDSRYSHTPYPVGLQRRRVESLPATLHATPEPCPMATRTSACHHHAYTYSDIPNDAHAQFHLTQLNHSRNARRLTLRADSKLKASPPIVNNGEHHMSWSTTHRSMPQSHRELHAKANVQARHALHIHRSFVPLARTLVNDTGHQHEHDHGHRSKHDHLRMARPFSEKAEWVVGTFESQRYMNLEATRLHDPRAQEWTKLTFGLLRESCTPLLGLCVLGIKTTNNWLTNDVRSGRLRCFFGVDREEERRRMEEVRKGIKQVRDRLKERLKLFKEEERHLVLNPYLQAFEYSVAPSTVTSSPISHTDVSLSGIGHAAGAARAHFRLSGDRSTVVVEGPIPKSDAMIDTVATNSEGGVYLKGKMSNEDYSPSTGQYFYTVPDSEDALQDDPIDNTHSQRNYAHGRDYPSGAQEASTVSCEMPPHRYLFNCYVYQYNLIQMSSIIIEMLDVVLRLEAQRLEPKLWAPVTRLFTWTPWSIADSPDTVEMADDDYDPDIIQGSHKDIVQAINLKRDTTDGPTNTKVTTSRFKLNVSTWYEPESESTNLGLPHQRDPDSLPPRNMFEWFCYQISSFVIGLGGGNALYALKAGALTVLLCLPNFIRGSAAFAIANRFSWGIFMGQLSLSRFRGDTTFILVVRITSTFLGGIVGMVMWYISTGSGNGNPYSLAATCFVCFPFFFFARLYLPVNQLMNIVFFVTAVLVVGFSYQDQHVAAPGSPGTGYRVFWKRTLLVSAGVTAAFIASLFPPATTIRRYERRLLATTSAEIGATYCAILSFATTKREAEIQDIVVSLIALRTKLTRSNALRTNVWYEFSFRGRWPSERYEACADLQMALAYSLSHLMSVLEHLEPSWSRAFLQRTRFMDPDFQGDILAVFSMISNSLRNGTPLPQITPCPLLDRFTHKYHGLDVIHKDSEEDYGLPRNLSIDTLRNEQYLMFCVGISIAYGVINRLDKLMLAVKEIVGEQFHIHGVGPGPR